MHRRLASAALVVFSLGLWSCEGNDTARQIEQLKAQVKSDQEMLRVDAETRDPSRKNLKATFMDTSVMSIRPTSNPERPMVAFVRIKWHFDYTDGRPLGDAVFDYVYARLPNGQWVKADEAEIPEEIRGSGGSGADDAAPPEPPSSTSKVPA